MMDQETQIKIQAFLDGELAENEARKITALIARDREAAALHAELKNTRRALAGAEQGITLPESRDFYWSKIRRQIEQLDQSSQLQSVPAAPSFWESVNRLLKPVSALAIVVLLGMMVFNLTGSDSGSDLLVASSDMDTITFRDDSDDTTFVWFADKPENDVANVGDDTTLN
ncbi:MAG: hypothetical protein RLY20_242 [Verrucomicrobiota bacterium]|jgi:anti-sigma factor RsiW